MGGCATKPKEPHGHLPDEDPSAPELVAKSVEIPAAAPATAVEVKEAGDGGKAAGKETGEDDAPAADGSKPEAEPKTEAAAAVTGEEAGAAAQDGSDQKAKVELPNPDAAAEEAPKDGAVEDATAQKEEAAPVAADDACAGDQMTVVVERASAGEATEEAKKPQEAKTWVEEVSHKEVTAAAAANYSSSA